MKKRLLFIIWMLALLSSAHVTISSLSVANGTNVVKLGDLNADGFVNVADITQLVNFLNSNLTNQINLTAADANHDGVINSDDESAIASIILSGTPDNSSKSILFFTQPTVEKTFGVAFTNPVVCAGSTGAITYSASPDGVVTVNPATGDVSYIGIGQTTITATLAADDKYSGAKAQYTLTVVEKSTDPDDYMSIKPKASTDGNGGSLSYTGNPIPIITAGESSAGTIYYKVTSINVQPTKNDEGWTTAVPTTIAAGTYYVWYYIKGNDNTETAICRTPIRVTICNATLSGITVTAYNAVYDGNAHGITVSLNGVAEGATIKYGTTEGTYNLTTSPTYTDVTAGATVYYQVTKSNYETVTGSSTVTITHKALSIKAKDQAITFGNTIATSTDQVIVDGLVKGDALTAVTLTPSGTDVTTTGTITPSAAATVNGIDNYTVTYTTGKLLISASLSSGVSVSACSATYDGLGHSIIVSLSGVAEGATVMYGIIEGIYDQTTSPTFTNVTDGTSVYYQVMKANYETVTGSSTVTIAKRSISISGITANNKIYDGTTAATLNYPTITTAMGLVKGDNLSVTATGTFSDANAGDSKTVTISNLTLSGSSVGNYKLADSDQQISEYEASSTVIATTGNASYHTVSDSALSNGVSTITVTGVEAGSADCTISASSNNYIYTKVSKPITVKANPLKTVTEEHLGYYVCTDGYYYSPDFEVPLGKTVAGFIAYVSGKGHGLILAMSDANSGSSADWSTINSACSSYTPTITSGCVTLTWRLPSMTDWENMGATSGSWKTLSSRLSALSSKVQSIQSNSSLNSSYWSCTTTSNGFPYVYNFYGKTWNAIGSYQNKYGRACAEF